MAKVWFQKHLTMIGAIGFTVCLAYAAFTGKIQPSRVLLTLSFVWTLALHSLDVNRHGAEVVEAISLIALAGADHRKREDGKCVQDLELAAEVAAGVAIEVVEEIGAQRKTTTVSTKADAE